MEEGPVHAQLDRQPVTKAGAEILEENPEEPRGVVAVVNVPGSVPDPKDLAELGQVRRQRVVGRVLGMVGVEAPLRAVHLGAGAQDRPIEVDRQPGQTGTLDLVVHQVPDQLGEPLERRRGEGLQPGHHSAIRGGAVKPREAQQDRIGLRRRPDG